MYARSTYITISGMYHPRGPEAGHVIRLRSDLWESNGNYYVTPRYKCTEDLSSVWACRLLPVSNVIHNISTHESRGRANVPVRNATDENYDGISCSVFSFRKIKRSRLYK